MSDQRSKEPSQRSSQLTIHSDRLLLVEGPFDSGFLSRLLARSGRAGVQTEPIGGKNNRSSLWSAEDLRGTYASIKSWALASGAEDLKWVGIALDADGDPDASFDRARAGVRLFVRTAPPEPAAAWKLQVDQLTGRSSTVFVFPGGAATDDIERYIWDRSLQHTPFGRCIDSYIECILGGGSPPEGQWKARVNCFVHAEPRLEIGLTAERRGAALSDLVDAEVFSDFWSAIPAD